jgi:hypothetical protein
LRSGVKGHIQRDGQSDEQKRWAKHVLSLTPRVSGVSRAPNCFTSSVGEAAYRGEEKLDKGAHW